MLPFLLVETLKAIIFTWYEYPKTITTSPTSEYFHLTNNHTMTIVILRASQTKYPNPSKEMYQ